MTYTLEQKREAFELRQLWWRYPSFSDEFLRSWTRVSDDVRCISTEDLESLGAEYHIGPTAPTPPRVLSELEGVLLEALKVMVRRVRTGYDGLPQGHGIRMAEEAIQKAEAKQ